MPILYSWSVRRSGAAMTISHSCGKIVNVTRIEPNADRHIIAYKDNGERFRLFVVQ